MSVAFTREEDGEAAAAHLPDRPVSPHPNLVTPSGLRALEDALNTARAAYAAAQSQGGVSVDRTALARATRELRYFSARRASAQLVEPDPRSRVVQFGGTVDFERPDGRRQTFRLVGEDEADPGRGMLSYVAPLAQALLGKAVGDDVAFGSDELNILAVGVS